MSLGEFYTQLEDYEGRLEAARAKLVRKGEGVTDPDDLAAYRTVADEFAEWRRGIRVLGGRPVAPMAPVGVGAHDPTVEVS